MKIVTCIICGKERKAYGKRGHTTGKYCSFKCKGVAQTKIPKEKQAAWKGGRVKNYHGYMLVRSDKGYVYEHRLVMEKAVGRKLAREEVVHHIDGDRENNKKSNLIILKKRLHDKFETTRRHKKKLGGRL